MKSKGLDLIFYVTVIVVIFIIYIPYSNEVVKLEHYLI